LTDKVKHGIIAFYSKEATMAMMQARPGQRLLLQEVDWRTYGRFLRLFSERPSIRLTYDRGMLEIMSPSHEHESDGRFLGRLAVTLTEELALPVKAGGSTTFRRKRRRRGLEPDDCYWIANEPKVRGKRRIDLRIDPPPDLTIEVDVQSSSLDRMGIYAALKVPEVWRLDSKGLTFHKLASDGCYQQTNNSLAFPFLTPADLAGFLALRCQLDENAVIRKFRAWIRQQLGGGTTSNP
jgi:Uma2 family endonuclease